MRLITARVNVFDREPTLCLVVWSMSGRVSERVGFVRVEALPRLIVDKTTQVGLYFNRAADRVSCWRYSYGIK